MPNRVSARDSMHFRRRSACCRVAQRCHSDCAGERYIPADLALSPSLRLDPSRFRPSFARNAFNLRAVLSTRDPPMFAFLEQTLNRLNRRRQKETTDAHGCTQMDPMAALLICVHLCASVVPSLAIRRITAWINAIILEFVLVLEKGINLALSQGIPGIADRWQMQPDIAALPRE
jgi:hypothetical protein